MLSPREQSDFTDAILPAVIEAGRVELGLFRDGCAVTVKADRSPVTEADIRAEAILLEALSRLLPAVSEEAFADGARPVLTDPFLLVDPLDGTKQFVSGRKEFTINVALILGGRPVYGLIFAPALSDLLVTGGPDTAYRAVLDLSQCGTAPVLGDLQPVLTRVRTREAIVSHGGIVALLSQARDTTRAEEMMQGMPVVERRRLGSSYKFCEIASGVGDLYPQLGDTSEWDTAAGEAIVLAAGGHVARLDGSAMAYGQAVLEFRNPKFVASSLSLDELRAL
ncbi:MAG: 3'(2'),5'-bisphosphate nucleotidase CysQ [Hyphomicrobiaceae bacterium]|nr:3'(2'),5'-bisphosphate nucleotidase CysQ [Hyphomicrobiaceae bacterium]